MNKATLAALASLFHDFGKSSDLFQQELADGCCQPARHEWVSLRMFAAFVQGRPDPDWIAALASSDYVDKREKEIVRDNPPAVYCDYRVEHGYNCGVGLHMVIDAPVLTVELIETAIADFIAYGENAWFASEPASVTFESGLDACPLK